MRTHSTHKQIKQRKGTSTRWSKHLVKQDLGKSAQSFLKCALHRCILFAFYAVAKGRLNERP